MSAEVVTPSTYSDRIREQGPSTTVRSAPYRGFDRASVAVPVVILPGRRFVMELLATWMDELGADVALATNADATAAALRVAANKGVLLVDAGSSERLGERQTLVSRCREQGAEILAVMADDDPLAIATWVEAGATGVLSHHAPLTDVVDMVVRLSRHEIVMGIAVREGLLARLRARRVEDEERSAAFAQLTRREAQVLRALATGVSPDEVARVSFVSLNTVRSQIRSVLAKLGVNSVVAAVALSYRSGWLPGDS